MRSKQAIYKDPYKTNQHNGPVIRVQTPRVFSASHLCRASRRKPVRSGRETNGGNQWVFHKPLLRLAMGGGKLGDRLIFAMILIC